MAVMNLGLSLRYYSPKIEMFSQMADNKMTNLNCNNFIDIGGNIVCDLKELQIFLDQSNYTPSATYTIDHFYLGKKNSNKTLILYGQIGTNGFSELHNNLKILTESNQINYVLRHYIKNRSDKKLRLSGYGVELQMKSTEYKATDDLDVKDAEEQLEDNTIEENDELDGIYFSVLKNSYPSKLQQLENLQKFLLDNNNEIGSFKVWQYQELSHQAAERIMSSSPNEAIHVLTDISQNFPIMAKSLIKIKVNNDLKNEMKSNQDLFTANLNIQPSETALFVNGLYFDFDVIDILTLLDSVRSELRVMEALHEMGFDRKEMNKILALDLSNNVNTQDFAIDIRDSAINWINDIEHDSQYKGWSYSLTKLFHPTFPGMLRNIRRNLYNLVIILDPTSKKSVPLITWAKSLYTQTAPLRIGFVFLTNFDMDITGFLDASVAANNGYHYFMEKKSPNDAIDFLFSLLSHATDDDITVDDVKNTIIFKDVKANISDILGENSEYDIGRHLANDFIKKIGFKKFPQVLLNGVPLPSNQLNTDAFEEAVLSMIMSQTPFIQKAFYRGEVTDKDDIVDFLMNQTNVMPRINERILKTDTNQWLNLLGSISHDSDFKKWSSEETTLWLMKNVHYIHLSRKITTNHLFTLWLVLDLELQSGRTALKEALEYLKLNSDTRLTIIIHRGSSNMSEMNINRIVLAAMSVLPAKESYQYVRRLIDDSTFQTILNGKFKIENEVIKDALKRQNFLLDVQHYYCTHVLGFKANEKVVIFNGRIIGPLDDDEEFTSEDFVLLERFSYATYGNKLFKYLDENNFFKEKENTADIIMKITSLLVQKPHSRSRFDVPYYDDKYSVVNIPARNSNAVAFNIISIVDPVSRGAQKLGPILDIIQNTVNCDIKIFLNSVEKNSDIPLKSFYRFVLNSELQFTNEGEILGASAKFTKLPTSSLLTQNIHVPENWLVEVVNSIYDLDNIRLDNVAIGVHSEYELEYLLLEGHCFETLTGSPPRGLQITLGTEKQPMMVDTIVMANLGYFQLKAYPGEWLLRLRQGRSAEIYDISSIEGSDVLQKENSIKVLISSLKSNVLKLKVTKKPDKMNNDLLGEDDEEIGIWNSISRTFSNSDDGDEQEEKLNIFSLASGHLYERFLKIMMLSVIKHTKTPVKFWFLKNYLSPTLKNFLPHMAKEYGFEYELVQYKWPRWLHQQTEKQRTIWGYKILFLDVLFPLDVKKIIFVDADQVVRADLKELASMDLGGAPYAYTPFCDSRKEMDGFRFWKQGYWKNHLQGRSYHISALYVVNLKRFRRIAAGDRLRGQYQALSQDPNSLSNLDQDLPNNMIHQVAIKTLPQEWLWCETWCDDKSKKNAKTIDLCNNPMTKEAKLQAAMRIIPEWTSYDEELKRLQMKIDNESRLIENEEHDIQIPTIHEEL